ncbi:MAG TPA: urease accessory protein UreF [Burkholderiales bacterium]|nr:urease accessory protein UreF [Burkholderiales bacterium]
MSLARLLQLASPALPVGAYSYSGGLEAAVEAGVVKDAKTAQAWIEGVLEHSIGTFDAPCLRRMIQEPERQAELNDLYLASRETAELRAETLQMGYSLCRLLRELGLQGVPEGEVSFPAAFAFAARSWGIAPRDAVQACLWGWLENQVMAALKAVPFGQTDGQKILLSVGDSLARFADDEEITGNFTPALAILSSRHETQYSRLFRS